MLIASIRSASSLFIHCRSPLNLCYKESQFLEYLLIHSSIMLEKAYITSTTMYILRPLMALWLKRVLIICELLRLLVHVVVANMHLVVRDLCWVH